MSTQKRKGWRAMGTEKVRCAIYARVSTEIQKEKHTIRSQRQILPEYAEKNGWVVVGEHYVDDGFSGETIEGRPAFKRLLVDCDRGIFDAVLVTDLDRLSRSRDSGETSRITKCFEKNSIRIVTSGGQNFDLSDIHDHVFSAFGFLMSSYEKRQFLERSKRGRVQAWKDGRYTGSNIAYGYIWEKEEKAFRIVAEEAEIVKMIYRLCIDEDLGSIRIAQELNRLGIPTRSEKQYPQKLKKYEENLKKDREGERPRTPYSWNPSVVDYILTSSTYIGVQVVNKKTGKDGKVTKHKDEWIDIPYPAIVTQAYQGRADAARQRRKKFKVGYAKHLYLCTGVLFCQHCGHRLGGITQKGRKPGHATQSYYKCVGRGQKGNGSCGCELPYFYADEIDRQVWEVVVDLVKRPGMLKQVVDRIDPEAEGFTEKDQQEIENSLEVIGNGRRKIINLVGKGVITEDQAAGQLGEMSQEEKVLKARGEEIENWIRARNLREHEMLGFEQKLQSLRGRIDDLSFEEKRKLLKTIVPGDEIHHIAVSKDGNLTIRGVIDFSGPAYVRHLPCASKRSVCPGGGVVGSQCAACPQPPQRGCDAQPRRHRSDPKNGSGR
jgi:site-specific DNA recombinase